MNFADIFKTSFLEGYASGGLSIQAIAACMASAVILAAYIFLVYRLANRNSFYDKSFNSSLPAMAILTAAIILTIQSSIVISLGMVGALSIVRFRTAVKDPMDLVFLFWSISVGIICGAGFTVIAAVASFVLTVVILFANALSIGKAPVILLVDAKGIQGEKEISPVIEKYCSLHKVRARNLTKERLDMAIEVRVREEEAFLAELIGLETVTSASLVAHDGEVTF